MKQIQALFAAAVLMASASGAYAYDPKATIADLDARLAKIGAPRVEGTDEVAGKTVPAIFFGDRKINNNYDVVDAVRKAHNATATIFVRQGDEFVRVSTNVLTPEGKRGIGTQLARNAAYEAVSKGQQYCGPIDVLGTAFDACYNPIKVAGKVVGVSYIGHKK
jgi:Cache 3/Cache 2 fusion domain